MEGRGGRGGNRVKTSESTNRQAAARFSSTSECLATTPRMPLGISHKSFLSSALEQFIRLRESSATLEASHQVVPNNAIGQVFKDTLPRNYAHKTGVLIM